MDFVYVLLIAALVLIGPWILLARSRGRLKREREENAERWADLTRRVYDLERSLKDLQTAGPQSETRLGQVEAAAAPQPRVEIPPTSASVSPAPREQEAEPVQAQHPFEAPSSAEALPEPRVAPPFMGPDASPPTPATREQAVPPAFLQKEPSHDLFYRLKGGLDLEEALGANWLNKIGVVILVFGVAFFLAYQLRQVGPAGKVLVGVLVSGALLGTGIFLERKPGYRILGRAGIGGGWALAFFTAYAMYHVPAARVFTSQAPSLLLMLAVAAGMVVYTLRYRSQVVTGLAFLLAFSTLTVSQVTVYSLVAGAVLALGLVVIVGRMQWFELEIFGIAAAYLNHWWWLRRIIEPMRGHKHAFPEFVASAGLLIVYWAIFRTSYILRHCDERRERVSTIAALLNSVGLLALLKYQSVHPQWTFWALLALGTVEIVLSLLPVTRRRRVAFLILSTIGATLLVAAMPFRFTGARLDGLWLLEAETLLLAGVFVREIHFRRLGMLASLLTPIYLLSGEVGTLFGLRHYGLPATRDIPLGILCFVAASVFFANSHIVARRWSELFDHVVDRTVMHRFSFVGALLLFVAAWAVFPLQLTAVAWAVLGLALLLIGWRLKLEQLPFEAHFYFACAFLAALFTNLPSNAAWGHISQRLVTVSLISALFYLASRWCATGTEAWPRLSGRLPPAYRWAASALLILLAYYALRPASVSPAWVLLGLVLMEVGFARRIADLRAQGYIALACAFVAIFFVNLNADETAAGISVRLLTVAPVALALFYVYFRLEGESDSLGLEQRFHVAVTAVWCGTIAVAALLRFEVSPDWVAAAWATLSLALIASVWRSGRQVFLQQALVLAVAATFRGALHNLYERSHFPGPFWHGRTFCTSVTAALLFASLWFAFQLRKRVAAEPVRGLTGILRACSQRPEQIFFFLALGLLIALLTVSLRSGLITVSWSALGVIVFLFALWVGERSFRLAGLALLLLGVGKIIVVDVWRLSPRDRYLTFITMGSALLLVSFLYSRYREAIRRYL
ncbi:MAG TPA: DUF2339 domain-containing protein [Candidatus Sulfotelmatobacter sp.]|nr:DUF2339 domain-containing protein [Candidatus Sulfotelmatobacter sp.]